MFGPERDRAIASHYVKIILSVLNVSFKKRAHLSTLNGKTGVLCIFPSCHPSSLHNNEREIIRLGCCTNKCPNRQNDCLHQSFCRREMVLLYHFVQPFFSE